jgi:eukaryotic-like serine/threonine-protein kinase
LVLRWEAIQLERVGRRASLGAIDLRLTAAPVAVDGCPSIDDILDFSGGQATPARAEDIQRHIDGCRACLELVTGALHDWGRPAPVGWLDIAGNFRPGDRIEGRFRIVRLLGRGGMGEVYEAIDLASSARVALKAVIATHCDSVYLLGGFRREARLGRRVCHSNVCRIHRPARPEGARSPVPYFTMEFIEGVSLNERLLRGPLSIEDSLRVAGQILSGLRAIHAAGVLHLDIKSSNVMLDRSSPSRAVILDFGLARPVLAASRARRVRPLTGSLPYMPPEQILGRSPSVQNDVFAFGVVLFQMLTGELPFPSAQPSTTSSIVRRLSARAPRPSQLAPRVPRWLDDVVLGCTTQPEHRFASVEAVVEALDAQ